MSGVEILGLFSAAVDGVKISRIMCDATMDTEDLPEAFHEVNKHLELVHRSLEAAQKAVQDIVNAGNNHLANELVSFVATIAGCNKKLEELKETFLKLHEFGEGRHPFRKRYRAVVERLGGTNHRVEALTRDILDDILSLRANQVFHLAIQDQVDDIHQALEALNVVEPSVEEGEEEFGSLSVHSDSSTDSSSQSSDGDMHNVYSIQKPEDRQDSAEDNTNERIESERNAEQWEARPAEKISEIQIFDRRNSVYRFMLCQVDTSSSINFLTREMAVDYGLEIQSLGSEPFLCQTVAGEFIFNEYVNVTLVVSEAGEAGEAGEADEDTEADEDSEARSLVETVFYVLPSDIPSDVASLTKPVIRYHPPQVSVYRIGYNETIDLRLPTRTSTENTYMKERSQEEVRMNEADDNQSSFEGRDKIRSSRGAFHDFDPTQIRPYRPRTPVTKKTAGPYAPTSLSSDLSQGSSKPTQIFSAGHSVSTKPTATSQAGIYEENPHFSGYDDTSTNYTSPWKEHPHSKALIRGLAQHLNEEAKSFSRDEGVLNQISAALPDLVRAFALRLGYSPRTTDDRDVALFLRRNRLLIGDAFSLDEMEPEDVQHDSELERIKAQRMEQWQSQVKSHDPADIEVSNHRDDDDLSKEAMDIDEIDDTDDIAPQEIAKYRKIITGSAQYSWLLADMRRLCILTPGSPEDLMEKVRDTVRTALPRNIPISKRGPMPGCEVTFEVPWDPSGFWQKEKFHEDITRGLENAITITGSAEDAQATTAGEYLTQTWPVTAKHALKLMKKLVNGLETPWTASESLPDGTSIYAKMEGGGLRITATGAEDTIVEVGQQFIWLAAALRSSPHDDGVTACHPNIRRAPGLLGSSPAISVDFTFKEIASGKHGVDRASGFCWQDMFRNPVIVGGFPILKKPAPGLGLEMPFRLMAALAGSERLSEFSGRTYIKGYSAMVVATAVLTNTVVWHYCYNKQGGRIAYADHDLQSCPRVSMQQLTTSRHIVGWCSTCKVYAGAADALYESIGPSDADSPSSGMILDRINLSFSHFGVGGGASLALCTRVKPKHYRPKDYVGMIEWIKTTYVVMWDEETKIGWLVNGTNAILHLARAKLHAWHSNRIYSKLLLIEPDELKDDGDRDPESAACTLLDQKNRKLKIWIASNEIKTTHGADKSGDEEVSSTYLLFADVVEELVDKFEILFDEQADKAGRSGINLRRQVRRHLEGWDFRDVLQGSEISPRQVTLGFGGWGWVNFARSINVVTLIGRRFGQLIRPAQSDEVCTEWQSVKRKKYYLAASIFDLKEIRRDKPSKISHLLWHSPQDPFAKCPRCGELDHQGEPDSTRDSNDTEEHHIPVQAFWPTQIPSCVKKLKEPQYLKQGHSDGGAVIFENVVTPWFSWTAGADLNENPSPTLSQPKNSANEDIGAEKSHTDTQNLPRRVKQKFSHFFHPSPPQQSGGESTSDTRAGSASVSEDAVQGQLQGSVDTSDTSWASEPAQDCQNSEGVVQKRRKLGNHIYK